MNGPRDYHTEGHKSDRERQIYDIAYMWYLKKKRYKTETDSQTSMKGRNEGQIGSLG